jgi:hypothetical protein
MEPKADIAVIGLAVMGQNLILNMNDHGFTVAAFNRTVSKVDDFLNKEAKGTNVIGAHSIEEMVGLLKKPRRVMLMVKPVTSSSTAATPSLKTRSEGRNTSSPKASSTSAPAFRAAKRVPAAARASCPAARPPPGRT